LTARLISRCSKTTLHGSSQRLIKLGAKTLLVPGVIPSGCSPPVLALYPDAEHDPRTGCLRAHNELGRHHNALLQQSLEALRARHPDARITYADLFTPVMEMVESRAG
jgi:phospholipase/lecithinase/hemolysin